jgi:hypothetical protein
MHFISHTAAAAFSCVRCTLWRVALQRQTHDILLDLHCYAAAIIIARGHTLHIFNQHLVGVAFSSRVCVCVMMMDCARGASETSGARDTLAQFGSHDAD